MLFKILYFLLIDIYKFCLDKLREFGLDMLYNIIGEILSFIFGSSFFTSTLTSLFGNLFHTGFRFYSTDEKRIKLFYMILKHLDESGFRFLIIYGIIYLINIIFLIIIIIINIILKLKNNYKEFCLNSKVINEERRNLIQKSRLKKYENNKKYK